MSTAIVIIVVIAVLVWAGFTQVQARQQVDVETTLSPNDAAHIVEKYFGAIWTSVSGSGRFNYRPKLRKGAPTISVDIQPAELGCEVHIWTSAWKSYFGLMNHATLMWRKKRGLASRLLPEVSRPEPTAAD